LYVASITKHSNNLQ